jgi:hypothetical protein
MASVRANPIAQQMSTLGELQPAAQLGRSAKTLTVEFHGVFRSSQLSIAQFL